jgi:hypothetical protein
MVDQPPTPPDAAHGPHDTPPGDPAGAPPGPRERMAALVAWYERARSRWCPPPRPPARPGGPAAAPPGPRQRMAALVARYERARSC